MAAGACYRRDRFLATFFAERLADFFVVLARLAAFARTAGLAFAADFLAFDFLAFVGRAAALALRAVGLVTRRAAVRARPAAVRVAELVFLAAVRAAVRTPLAPRDAAWRTTRVAVRARVTTGFAISAVTVAAVPTPLIVADATPCAALVIVLAIASSPPAAVPSAAPTVSAAEIKTPSSSLLLLSS